jgi:chemotaxis protein CheD
MKYVDCALKEMLRLFRKKSVPLASVSAAVFGGSTQHVGASDKESVGEKNLRVAKRILAFHRIPVYQESTGGVHGRTILLDCATGDVMVKMHGRSAGKH